MCPRTTVCVLLFGDYPALAARVLGPVVALRNAGLVDLVVGCNAVSETTAAVVSGVGPGPAGVRTRVVVKPDLPAYKYPTMRRMFAFHSPDEVRTDLTMWFDDDSHVTAADPRRWLAGVEALFEGRRPADVVGQVFTMRKGFLPGQAEWVAGRTWYAGRPVRTGHKVPFATGGWWAARTAVLRAHDWPDPDIVHNGGDEMFGELIRQHGYALTDHSAGVSVNAERRRGASLTRVGAGPQVPQKG